MDQKGEKNKGSDITRKERRCRWKGNTSGDQLNGENKTASFSDSEKNKERTKVVIAVNRSVINKRVEGERDISLRIACIV